MMLESGNDAANAVAIYLAGSLSAFSNLMNEKAKEIGMKNTHFVTPSGLDDEEHYSNAYDMALLASYCIKNPCFKKICSTKRYNAELLEPDNYRLYFSNHNRLLSSIDGVFGVKTGFTKKSGRCLVSAIEKDGAILVAVTLSAPDDWNDHKKLYSSCLEKYASKEITINCPKKVPVVGGLVGFLNVRPESDTVFAATKNSEKVTQKVIFPRFVYAPIKENDVIGKVVVLVGDKDQLASVGVGNVLNDLIKCGKFNVSYLTQIYRQSEQSKIVPNAHKINNGIMPDLDNKSNDFFYEERNSSDEICQSTLGLVTKRLPKYLNMSPSDIQVLCPMKRGSAGTINLNRELQKAINPPSPYKKEVKHGDCIYREGDKVMQLQNNYQQEWSQTIGTRVERGSGVFNGDIGVIESINTQIMQFTVRFDDDKVSIYEYSDVDQLTLAYAVTIHKSQGCEFDAVVIALDANYMLQTRNLLYTAVTRAKKLVVISGSKKTMQRMIQNNETARRYSLLIELIEQEWQGGAYD